MMWTEKNIFEPSGCLTRDALSALLGGTLPVMVKDLAEKHISECPFCSDAKDGYIYSKKTLSNVLTKVDKDFENKFYPNSSVLKSKKVWISIIATAASVLLLVSIFIINKHPIQTEQIVFSEEKKTDSVTGNETVKPVEQGQLAMNNQPKSLNKDKITKPITQKAESKDVLPEQKGELAFVEPDEEINNTDADVSPASVIKSETIIFTNAKQDTQSTPANMQGYFAYNEEKEFKADKLKKNTALRNRSVTKNESIPASEVSLELTQEELPKFKYKEFNNFASYLVMQFPEADSVFSQKIIIKISIDEKGNITEAGMIKGINPEIDEIILKKVKSSPKWIPAIKEGKNIKSVVAVPIDVQYNK